MESNGKYELVVVVEQSDDDTIATGPNLANLLAVDESWLCQDCEEDVERCLCKRPC